MPLCFSIISSILNRLPEIFILAFLFYCFCYKNDEFYLLRFLHMTIFVLKMLPLNKGSVGQQVVHEDLLATYSDRIFYI